MCKKKKGDKRNSSISCNGLICMYIRYTLGRGASLEHLKFPSDNSGVSSYELYRIERGGEVTYHTPGQIVIYPILNLNRHKRDLHWYLRQVSGSIVTEL